MRPGIFLGASAWVLGAVAATSGSLYAVDQLGHGLLGQNVAQATIAKVNSQLQAERSHRPAAASASPSPSSSPSRSKRSARSGTAPTTPAGPKPTAAGRLLTSPDGTVSAFCQPGGAYLIYWYAQPGFEAEHVQRGPLPVASVTFGRFSGGGELMTVSCSGGTPVAHVSPIGWHDE